MSKTDEAGNVLDDKGVYLVKTLIGAGWCCAPKHMTLEQVQEAVDNTCEPYLPGTPWTVAPREHSDADLRSPGYCKECPDTRQHWFLIGGMSGLVLMAAFGQTDGFPEGLEVRLAETKGEDQ